MQSTNGQDFSIGSVFGNQVITNSDLPSGTNTIVGKVKDVVNNRVLYAVHNSNNNHTIYSCAASVFTRVLRTSLFTWTATSFVDMDILGEILVITDNSGEIIKINVTKAIAGATYTPLTNQILTLIKRPPQLVLTCANVIDGTFANNFIFEHYFQFYYRYIYEDDDPSVYSNMSDIIRASTPTATTENAIDVTIPASESIPVTVKQIDYAVRIDGGSEFFIYKSDYPVAGVLSSKTHRFYNSIFFETIADTESLKWFDSVPSTSRALKFKRSRLFLYNNTEGQTYSSSPLTGATLTVNTAAAPGRTFKHRGNYSVGIMFFDFAGRHAGVREIGTVTIPDRTDSNTVSRYTITWNVTAVAMSEIPLWATHYSIVMTKVKNISWFLSHTTADQFAYRTNVPGPPNAGNTFAKGSGKAYGTVSFNTVWDKWAFDISGLPAISQGYTFQAGDRFRIYQGGGVINDVPIHSQIGRFILTEASFDLLDMSTTAPTNKNFEIYRPKTEGQELFYEVGVRSPISNAGTGSRAFSVLTSTLPGDSEVQVSNTYTYTPGVGLYFNGLSVPANDEPYMNTFIPLATTSQFGKMNAFHRYFDTWASQPHGRSFLLQRVGSKQLLKTDYIRFSQPYILASGVSRLNVFDEVDEYQLPNRTGAGVKLEDVEESVLVATGQSKTTAIYIGQGFVTTSNSNNFLAKTDNVIGDDRKYLRSFGSLHPESFVERDGRVYYFDMTRGVVVRRSSDGLTAISNYGVSHFIRHFSQTNWSQRSAIKMHGGYDPWHDLYLLTAVYSDGTIMWTLGFYDINEHNDKPSWVGFFDYKPPYIDLEGYLFSVSTGQLWRHDETHFLNLYGVAKTRAIEIARSTKDRKVVVWEGLSVDGDAFYVDSGSNDNVAVITNDGLSLVSVGSNPVYGGSGGQTTTITYSELVLRQGIYQSAIKRDISSAQGGPYSPSIRAKFEGNAIRGNVIRIVIYGNLSTGPGRIRSVNILHRDSPVS